MQNVRRRRPFVHNAGIDAKRRKPMDETPRRRIEAHTDQTDWGNGARVRRPQGSVRDRRIGGARLRRRPSARPDGAPTESFRTAAPPDLKRGDPDR